MKIYEWVLIMKKSVKNFFLKIIKLLLVLIVLLSLTGYLGTIHWTLDLTSHFKVPYFVLSLFGTVVLLLARQWGWSSLGLLGMILNGMVILPWYLPTTEAGFSNLKLLLSNVHVRNQNYSALIQLVRTENPDILIVQEGNAGWIKQLTVLDETFPYLMAPPQSYRFGTVIKSRLPFEQTQILSLGTSVRESLLIKFKINGKMVSLLTSHPLPPISKHNFDHRNSQLFAVQSVLKQLPAPLILIGDLNITMWSPISSKLFSHIGLINARQGFGFLPTWPTALPFLRIPIDHCLVSSDIQVANIKTGNSVGSDHLPLIVELYI